MKAREKVDICSNMPAQNGIDDSIALKESYLHNAAVWSLLVVCVSSEGGTSIGFWEGCSKLGNESRRRRCQPWDGRIAP